MATNLRKTFHEQTFNSIYVFINIISGLSKHDNLQRAFQDLPLELSQGRNINQIILDDLMDAFATVMAGIPDDQIPKSFHQQILNLRQGSSLVSDEYAAKHLADLLAKKRAAPANTYTTPDFMKMFKRSVPPEVVGNILNNWIVLVNQFGSLMHSDESLAAVTAATGLVTSANAAQAANIASIEKTKKTIQDINEAGAYQEPDELAEISKKIRTAKMSPEANKRANKELDRLYNMNPQSSEYSIITKYLDVLTSLPWGRSSPSNNDINKTEDILDEDHYGMQMVKNAIAEHVAVQNRLGKSSGQILLLVGPPGVGKTSIAQSVAKATGRQYARMSLGGVSDESQIRGHKTTYVGAMPGEMVKAMIKAGTKNPLIVLDEIDKIGRNSAHGDPTAALLEALDPEQNNTFKDHYLDVSYDLSDVMFFCTANDFGSIPGPLRDRMQVIHLPGYLHDEKFEIAKRYLSPKQLSKKGVKTGEVTITESALHQLINEYTQEAGLRKLEQMIGKVYAKAVYENTKTGKTKITVTPKNLSDYAGVSQVKHDRIHAEDKVGTVNGLAYTTVGGCRLPIQAVSMPANSFSLTATGRLGDVMKESIQVANRLVRSHMTEFGITSEMLKVEIGLHAPEGSVPKDGPSAGLAMATVIISALTKTKIRHDVAMTGEVDLEGNALKIGGLPEKLEGALRAGVKTVLIPRDNVGNLEDVPAQIKSKLEIIPVDNIHDVLKHALVGYPKMSLVVDNTNTGSNPEQQAAAASEPTPPAQDNKGGAMECGGIRGWVNKVLSATFGSAGNDNTPPDQKKTIGQKPSDPNGPK